MNTSYQKEADVAQQLGISRDEVKQLRGQSLKLGHDYMTVKGETVITNSGMAKLVKSIGRIGRAAKGALAQFGIGSIATPPEEAAASPGPRQGAALPQIDNSSALPLKIVRRPVNLRIVYAQLPNEGAIVRVRVKTSIKFVPGMTIEARQIEGDLYQHVGRLPRFRGKY